MAPTVLAVVEQEGGRIAGSAGEIVSAAASFAEEMGGEAHALVVGASGIEEVARSLGEFGAAAVRVVAHDALGSYHPEGYLEAVEPVVRGGAYEVVVFAATGQGKDLAPRVAARLDAPMLQDVTGVSVDDEGTIVATRPVYAGKALATVRVHASPLLLTLRPNTFPVRSGDVEAPVETVSASIDPERWAMEVVAFERISGDVPDVSQASIVVSGGRGLKGPENWGLLERLRASLGPEAGLGASRAVVDAGWRPHSEQVGQTGKTVSPRLYFAVGISGAIQHLAGMRTAGTIVAVNKDPDAPIFKVADYGIVGDAMEILPRMAEEIEGLERSG
jgi:electron transfer flavoprotein alpha subunit